MNDAVSIKRIAALHPAVIVRFTKFINDCETGLNIKLRVVQGLRTIAEQNALYSQGRTTPGSIVTKAKGGSSFHNYGLAIDVVPMMNGKPDWNYDYSKLLPYADGLVWGGNFKSIKDKPHFELTFGLTWRTLLQRENAGDKINGWVRI